MRHRLAFFVCLSAALTAPGAAIGQVRTTPGVPHAPGSGIPLPIVTVEFGGIERLELWIKAVARHVPGQEDAALVEIASWPNRDLKVLWFDAQALLWAMRNVGAASSTLSVRPAERKAFVQVRYSKEQFHRLQILACASGGLVFEAECLAIKAGDELDAELRQIAVLSRASNMRGDRNYLSRRAAILHSDVAMLAPAAMVASGNVGRPAAGSLERFRMEISDGQELSLHQSAVHWEIARMLLDSVRPRGSDRADPGHDDMVRQWYRATAAWMQLKEDHDKVHLDLARRLFPNDPDILFLSACQRETYAGAPIQTAVRSAVLPTGVVLDVASDRVELREAEALFRRALEIKPDYAEARLRYGRVLGGLGKYAESAGELRRAVADLTDRTQLYYANLFLGASEEALGNRAAARVAHEQAAELSPIAQSPLLALSQLARRSGDRGGALRAIDRLFALPEEARDPRADPWWWYYVAQARDADDLLETMRKPYLTELLQ